MSSELWNSRFKAEEYVYGEVPNVFFREELLKLKPGTLLLPGEGEGRNAVYAAKQGWQVDAFDWSQEAKNKALQLAKKNAVNINYQIQDVTKFVSIPNSYDAIALIFIHLPEEERIALHRKLVESLKPGGTIILFAYNKSQLKRGTGGPKVDSLLYSLEDIISDFITLSFITLSQELIVLDEGCLHNGESEIIKYVGKKDI